MQAEALFRAQAILVLRPGQSIRVGAYAFMLITLRAASPWHWGTPTATEDIHA
jgi:hypothetical protein